MADISTRGYLTVPHGWRRGFGGGDQNLAEVRRQRLEIATERALSLPERAVPSAPERSVVDDQQG
jgi:hypothetical protein